MVRGRQNEWRMELMGMLSEPASTCRDSWPPLMLRKYIMRINMHKALVAIPTWAFTTLLDLALRWSTASQFTFCHNRSKADAISPIPRSALV